MKIKQVQIKWELVTAISTALIAFFTFFSYNNIRKSNEKFLQGSTEMLQTVQKFTTAATENLASLSKNSNVLLQDMQSKNLQYIQEIDHLRNASTAMIELIQGMGDTMISENNIRENILIRNIESELKNGNKGKNIKLVISDPLQSVRNNIQHNNLELHIKNNANITLRDVKIQLELRTQTERSIIECTGVIHIREILPKALYKSDRGIKDYIRDGCRPHDIDDFGSIYKKDITYNVAFVDIQNIKFKLR